MSDKQKTEADHIEETRSKLVSAALPHVAFDGWTNATYQAAVADSDVDAGLAKLAAPRRGYDLAIAFHRRGDRELERVAPEMALDSLRYSERVEALVRRRIELVASEREAVRRGATLFALPINAADGAKLIWGTADTIWNILGDTSRDYNWYTKRAILSGVYSSTVLFWLGDQSEGSEATWSFLNRRIGDVMQFEKTKARLKDNKLAQAAFAGPKAILERIGAPRANAPDLPVGLPGRRD